MNIIKLSAENVKKVSCVEIDANGEPVILTGDNGAGKSTILDSILMGLQGKRFAQPIKEGESRATIKLDIGEYIVTRKITQKNSYLEVVKADGEPVASPQKVLDAIVGQLTLDPLEFSRMKPKDQRKLLMEVVGVDVDSMDEQYGAYYAERTGVNKIAAAKKIQWEQMPKAPEGTPSEFVNADKLLSELEELDAKESANRVAQEELKVVENTRDNLLGGIEDTTKEIAELQAKIKELEQWVSESHDRVNSLEKQIAEFKPVEVDTGRMAKIREELSRVDDINANVQLIKNRKKAYEDYQEVQKQSDELTDRLDKIKDAKEKALREADFPVPGLSVSADEVTYQDRPFEQLSTGEQILVSTLIAMKLNPGVKIIMIREGALINSKNLQMLLETAKKNGYQVWMEKFQEEAGQIGLHLVDGSIVAKDGEVVSI